MFGGACRPFCQPAGGHTFDDPERKNPTHYDRRCVKIRMGRGHRETLGSLNNLLLFFAELRLVEDYKQKEDADKTAD